MGKWLLGLIILLIVSVLASFYLLGNKIDSMENDIRSALKANGHDYASVDMRGNVAFLTGEATSEAQANDARVTAENAKCSKCGDKRSWHTVNGDGLSFKSIPSQSPYTFNGQKLEDGSVVLDGYVGSREAKEQLLAKANALFDGKVKDDYIRIATGAPDDMWGEVLETNLRELDLLDRGRFVMEDRTSFISGEAATADIRARINALGGEMPTGYEFAANISVPEMAAENIGEVRSAGICQTLFDDLNDGKKIFFATDRAEIRGADSFDLLNTLASAANQCASFRIKIEGHTDNVGDAAYNQRLSEARANTVLAYLTDSEVDRTRMSAEGFGETQPQADNSTDDGRAQNRRIVFTVTQSE